MLARRPRVRPERPPEPHRVRDCGRRRRRRLHADVRPRTRVEPAFGAAPERAGARAPRHDAGAEPLATDRGAAYRRPTARPADARAGAGAHTGGHRVAETDADVDPNADTHPGGAGAHPAIAGAGPAGAGAQPYTRADLRLDGMTHPRVPRRWTIRSLAAAVAAGVAIAVPAGIVGAALVAPDAQPPSPTSRVVRAGPALLAVPSGWERAATPAGLGGLNAGRTAVLAPFPGLATSAVVTFGPGDGGSLVPRALRPLIADSLPPPRDASLGGRPAIAYREVLTRRADLRMDVTVLPTTAGMLAVACTSPANSGYDGSRCASSVSSVSVPGATALAPEPSLPLARALPAAIAGLDRARSPAAPPSPRPAPRPLRPPRRAAWPSDTASQLARYRRSSVPGRLPSSQRSSAARAHTRRSAPRHSTALPRASATAAAVSGSRRPGSRGPSRT